MASVTNGSVVIIQQGTTNLESAFSTNNAKWVRASKFGGTSGGGVSSASLQSAYNQASTINTSVANGAVQIVNVQALDTDKQITISNIATTETFSVDGDGQIEVGIAPNNYILPTSSNGKLTGDVLSFDSVTKQLNFTTPAGGTGSNLSLGAVTATTVDIDIDGGGTSAQIPESDGVTAGVMSVTKFNEVVANNAKVTNATHTGEVTGSTALTVSETVITNKTGVTAASADSILIIDDTDGLFKSVTAQSIADLGGGGGIPSIQNVGTTSLVSTAGGDVKGLVAGTNITFSPITGTDVTINSSITGSGAITTAYTLDFNHPGNLGHGDVLNLGMGQGVVVAPAGAYANLIPGIVGFDSHLTFIGVMSSGSYTAQSDTVFDIDVLIYNVTQSPALTGAITSTNALPNLASWKTLKSTQLTFVTASQRFYSTDSVNLTGEPTVGSLDGAWLATDRYICTLRIEQNNTPFLSTVPDVTVSIDFSIDV
jgi:hypothetical protein